jgi:uncharacterized protein YndB with AHSA1/START domain
MTEDFRCRVRYSHPVAQVFAAACRPGGRDGWWSTRGGHATGRDRRLRLHWSGDDFVEFVVDEWDPPRRMAWTCVGQQDGNFETPDEWVGTRLSFTFVNDGDGTVLEFVHRGLVPQLECYEVCDSGWDFFLRRSLPTLLATGAGLPYDAAA